MNGKQRRGVGQVRKTLNFSLSADLERYVKSKADRSHGGNVSHFIRSLIVADQSNDQSEGHGEKQEAA